MVPKLMVRLFGEPVELVSPLSVDECRRRLLEAMDAPMTFFGKRPVIGRIDGAWLRAWRRIGYRNSFQTQLTAELAASNQQTHIRCRFGMDEAVTVILCVVLGTLLVAAVSTLPGCVSDLLSPDAAGAGFPGLAIPTVMLVAVCGIVCLGRGLASGERQVLIDFVRETVDAKPI
jgi:hypothetical protein